MNADLRPINRQANESQIEVPRVFPVCEIDPATNIEAHRELRIVAEALGNRLRDNLLQERRHLHNAQAIAASLPDGPCAALQLFHLADDPFGTGDELQGMLAQDEATAMALEQGNLEFCLQTPIMRLTADWVSRSLLAGHALATSPAPRMAVALVAAAEVGSPCAGSWSTTAERHGSRANSYLQQYSRRNDGLRSGRRRAYHAYEKT